MNEKPYSCHTHTDCFANERGYCMVLNDTNFQGKDCPFFKTRAQSRESRRNAYFRLIATGRMHLIDKYGGGNSYEDE